MFICYLNDFPKICCSGKTCLYADDTSLNINGPSWEEIKIASHNNLDNLFKYFNKNNLLLNLDKTNCMKFYSKNLKNEPNLLISIADSEISQVEEVNFLGLLVDKNLNWNLHVDKVLTKISSGIFALSKLRYLCDIDTLRMIYFSYIHSVILFGVSLYGATSIKNLDSILKIQKNAIRIILKLQTQASVKEKFAELYILTDYAMYVYEVIVSLKSRMEEQIFNGDNHQYNTRQRNELAIPSHRLALFCKKPQYAGIKFLSKIPDNIRSEHSFPKFKNKLKSYLTNKTLYSFDEL